MSRRFESQEQMDAFLAEPRLAVLMYHGARLSPTGVPVWFDWDGATLRIFAARNSAKVKHIRNNPNVSVLVTNRVGEPEGWVAFDGKANILECVPSEWTALLDRVAPRYWDMTEQNYADEIENWRKAPEAFVLLQFQPESIRSGA